MEQEQIIIRITVYLFMRCLCGRMLRIGFNYELPYTINTYQGKAMNVNDMLVPNSEFLVKGTMKHTPILPINSIVRQYVARAFIDYQSGNPFIIRCLSCQLPEIGSFREYIVSEFTLVPYRLDTIKDYDLSLLTFAESDLPSTSVIRYLHSIKPEAINFKLPHFMKAGVSKIYFDKRNFQFSKSGYAYDEHPISATCCVSFQLERDS